MPCTSFQLRRPALDDQRLVEQPLPEALAPGQVLLSVDVFALTANNITYAAFGEAMHYWDFFPTGDADWGCVPVWGFATVLRSACEGIVPGERIYGYYPMASHVLLQPGRVNAAGFVDTAAHRAALHPVYNHYQRTAADPGYDPAREAQQMLLRPLFATSFLIDDLLAEHAHFGAHRILLSSASSKTAYGLAYLLSQRPGLEVVGLTSTANRGFVAGLGCYHRSLSYAEIGALPVEPAVYVDFAGSAPVRRAVHERLAESLRYSCAVGGTHWESLAGGADLPGPRPVLFFAPERIKKRSGPPPEGWGPGGLQQRLATAWQDFMRPVCDSARPWLQVSQARGPNAVAEAVSTLLTGHGRPEQGLVLSLHA